MLDSYNSESFRPSSPDHKPASDSDTPPVGKKRTREPGPYGHAGELLKKAIEKRGLSRKEFADELGVKGGERSITHWILGETWPREPEIRVRMRALLRDAAMDELESEWAKVLGLPHVSHAERRILEAIRDPDVLAAVEAAIEKARKKSAAR